MKRIAFITFCMVGLLLLPFSVSAFEVNSINYTITSTNTVEVSAPTVAGSYTGNIILPMKVQYNNKAYLVTTIGESAFQNCRSLTGISLPETVTQIGRLAFRQCDALESVTLPESLTLIGLQAFYNCSSLQSIQFPESLTTIDDLAFYGTGLSTVALSKTVTLVENSAFRGCTELQSFSVAAANPNYATLDGVLVSKDGKHLIQYPNSKGTIYTVPSSITALDSYAFAYSKTLKTLIIPNTVTTLSERLCWYSIALESVTLPESVTYIPEYAFCHCDNLTKVTIPNTVTSIRTGAFETCHGLKTINLPESVTSLGRYAFSGCTELTDIKIPEKVSSISDYSFSGCESLKNIQFPNQPQSIGERAFAGCDALTSLELPSTITFIGERAFEYCDNLQSVVLPLNLTTVRSNAFTNCVKLTTVYYLAVNCTTMGGDSDKYVFNSCNKLSQVYFGEQVKHIAPKAFTPCTSIQTITIPESVTTIGDYAFSGCTGLRSIYNRSTTPQVITTSQFSHVDKNACILYVPKGSLMSYATAPGWMEFMNTETFDPTKVPTLTAEAVTITCNGQAIDILGASDTAVVTVYSLQGALYYQGTDKHIELPAKGVCLVQVAGRTHKIVM